MWDPLETFLVQIVVKKSASEKKHKLSENSHAVNPGERDPGAVGSLKQENGQQTADSSRA